MQLMKNPNKRNTRIEIPDGISTDFIKSVCKYLLKPLEYLILNFPNLQL